MLDFELAEIYGYETKNFNRQVKNNTDKFNEYFMFQLSKEEYKEIFEVQKFHLKLIMFVNKKLIWNYRNKLYKKIKNIEQTSCLCDHICKR